jgi:hypothetical protein
MVRLNQVLNHLVEITMLDLQLFDPGGNFVRLDVESLRPRGPIPNCAFVA